MYTVSMLVHTYTGHAIEDAKQYGWEVSDDVGHKWSTLVEAVQAHIGSLNWGYRVALRDKNVKYINGLGSFQDAHTIKVSSTPAFKTVD